MTRCRLRIRGTIDEPLGRNSTLAPAATLPAAASSIPIQGSVTDPAMIRPPDFVGRLV